MKRLTFILTAILLCTSAFSQGVKFEEEAPFIKSLIKAKKENKVIFIDCYTSWCAPCKKLAKEIFPQKEVGDYFNANFINVKKDMEKGDGKELAGKYAVSAFPTMLFINNKGKVIHRITGYMSTEKLLTEAKKAMTKLE